MNDLQPRIGIPEPTGADPAYNQKFAPDYARAVEQAGGVAMPFSLRAAPADWRRLADRCDGFLLPGSPADVDPLGYGQVPEAGTAAPDAARESCDRFLLEHAAAAGKPVLGICFGLQSMNVWQGGTLVQHLTPVPVNHEAGSQVALAHAVLVTGQSLVGSLLAASEAPPEGAFRRLMVNSSHHQAVAAPGDGWTVVARSAQDGVIEALEGRMGASAMVGVQWHPERSVASSPNARSLFSWLVAEAWDLMTSGGDGDVGAV
jgi:putative glutamine amidotransferase